MPCCVGLRRRGGSSLSVLCRVGRNQPVGTGSFELHRQAHARRTDCCALGWHAPRRACSTMCSARESARRRTRSGEATRRRSGRVRQLPLPCAEGERPGLPASSWAEKRDAEHSSHAHRSAVPLHAERDRHERFSGDARGALPVAGVKRPCAAALSPAQLGRRGEPGGYNCCGVSLTLTSHAPRLCAGDGLLLEQRGPRRAAGPADRGDPQGQHRAEHVPPHEPPRGRARRLHGERVPGESVSLCCFCGK